MKTTKPRNQRKRLYTAPLSRRHKNFNAPLSLKLKETHAVNSVSVRTGDTVRVTRGERKGFEGKISQVNRKKYWVFVEGITREKVDGTTKPIPIHPSKIMVTRLNLDDDRRRKNCQHCLIAWLIGNLSMGQGRVRS